MYHSIIGLPGTGKTTFLAALWHLIDAGEVSTRLVLDKLIGDHSYLNSIVEAWRRCEEVPRTSMAAEASVAIYLHQPANGQKIVLGFPDLSGESFESQFATRSCHPSYVMGYEGDGGILLFVTADRAEDGLTILDLDPALAGAPESEKVGVYRDWSPSLAPEQVRLVDLLQFLQRPPFTRHLRRLAVAVSAWDVVAAPSPPPDEWLARELPLLHQFLTANSDSFEFRVYGVSAQGGDVTSDHRVELLKTIPSERIRCVGPDVEPHDLTGPIIWLTTGYQHGR
jgi:Double-GTPase 1